MTVRAVISVGIEVVGIDELGTDSGAFDLITDGVLGAAAIFGAAFGTECLKFEQLGVAASLWWVTDCWFRNSSFR